MKQRSMKRSLGPIAALGIASLVLAACGGGGSSDSTTTAPEPTGTETSEAPTDGPADAVGEAKARYDAAKAPITFTYPGEAFDAAPTAEGKSVAIISWDDRIPILAQWGDTIQAGFDEYGVKVSRSSADFDIEAIPGLFSQAVAANVDLIVTNAIPGVVVPFNIVGDIPVMTTNQTAKPGVAPADGIITDVSFDYTIPARLMADWYIVVSDAGVNGDAQVVASEGQASSPIMVEEIQAEIAELCPDCNVTYTDAQLDSWFDGTLANETRNALTANPNLKYLLPIYDGMTLAGTDPGIADAGSDATQASFNATPDVMKGIGTSSVLMDVGCPNDWFSYAVVDASMRIFAGAPLIDNYDITCRVFDTENIGEIDPATENSVNWYGINFLTEFQNYWGAP
jgi:ribose transport system substrate-binding protein